MYLRIFGIMHLDQSVRQNGSAVAVVDLWNYTGLVLGT